MFDPATCNVLEPRSGRFWRELSPGDDLRAAAEDECPEGGCILLRPGTHELVSRTVHFNRVGLSIRGPLNIFGRGQATVESPGCDTLIDIGRPLWHCRPLFTLDGLTLRTLGNRFGTVGVKISGGMWPRLQSCFINGASERGVYIADTSDFPPVVIDCRCDEERTR